MQLIIAWIHIWCTKYQSRKSGQRHHWPMSNCSFYFSDPSPYLPKALIGTDNNFFSLSLILLPTCISYLFILFKSFHFERLYVLGSVQSLSHVWLFVTPMNHIMPGLSVHHQLLEFTQTHVHLVDDATQTSDPLSSPFPPARNPCQHQSFPVSQHFTWGGEITGVSALASYLPKNTQGWSPLEWTGWISLQSKGLSRVFNTTVQKHQFFSSQLSSQSNSHIHTSPLEKP